MTNWPVPGGWLVTYRLSMRARSARELAPRPERRSRRERRDLRAASVASYLSTLALVLGIVSEPARSEEPSESELAKKTQNPVADLISVPIQDNTSYEFGPRDRTQNVLNIQPVVPFGLSENWNLISRTILPIVSTPSLLRGQDRQNGIGDISASLFVSPREPTAGWLIWGAGPVVNVPTASDALLGSDQWGAGMTAVALTIQGPIVAGALVNNVWSLEGPDFSRFLLQYFVNYNLPGGWYLSSAPILTADFEAEHDAWLVPVGGGFGKVHRFGKLPLNLGFQAFYNAEKPQFAADWSTRFQIQFLFPR